MAAKYNCFKQLCVHNLESIILTSIFTFFFSLILNAAAHLIIAILIKHITHQWYHTWYLSKPCLYLLIHKLSGPSLIIKQFVNNIQRNTPALSVFLKTRFYSICSQTNAHTSLSHDTLMYPYKFEYLWWDTCKPTEVQPVPEGAPKHPNDGLQSVMNYLNLRLSATEIALKQ